MNNNPIDYNRYYIWGWHDDSKYQFSIDRILKDSPNKIVIFAPEESEHDRQLVDVTYSKLDGDITVVIGSAKSDFYVKPISKNVTVCHWPTYWINATYYQYRDKPSLVDQSKVDKLYISLNMVAHTHRCMMMDELSHYDLIKHGHISWHEPDTQAYEWKYWKPQLLLVDPEYHDSEFNRINSYYLPPEYGTTLFNLIAETSIITPFITEKTITALFFKKPFMVYGSKGFHKALTNMGFELYDELFDYSFDEIEDPSERLIGIMENINNLKDQDYELLRSKVSAKTLRNHNHLIEIATSSKYIPEFVLSYLSMLKQQPELILPRDEWYLSLEKLLVE